MFLRGVFPTLEVGPAAGEFATPRACEAVGESEPPPPLPPRSPNSYRGTTPHTPGWDRNGGWHGGTMTSTQRFVGIDVSKDQLDALIRPDDTHLRVPNTDEGLDQLVERLRPV